MIMNNSETPLVSISCLVFNHAPYLRECLEGFMMQKTDFHFEVLIHDDASTDGSTEIIKEYEARFPDIIKPIYETDNQWVKGRRGSATFNFPRAKGKYIALCEGDDYWTDPLKLQKQVDFLEANPEYSMCFHNADNLFEDGTTSRFSFVEDKDYDSDNIFSCWFIPTASTLMKTEVVTSGFYKNDVCGANLIFGDTPIFLTCAKFGKVKGMTDVMCIYRRHKGSLSNQFDVAKYKALIKYCHQIGELFSVDSSYSEVRNAVDGFFFSLKSKGDKAEWGLLSEAFKTDFVYTCKLLFKRLRNMTNGLQYLTHKHTLIFR